MDYSEHRRRFYEDQDVSCRGEKSSIKGWIRERQKIMRSGPATQTAFACVKVFCRCPRSAANLNRRCHQHRSTKLTANLRRRIRTGKRSYTESRVAGLQSRKARPSSEEAATPGLPTTLARFGNRSAVHPRELPQNQPCAITGSVMSTPAVIAMSRIANL